MNIQALLSGDITRLRYVTRFSNCRRNHDESVAEHSYFTALYGYLLGEYAESEGVKIDWHVLIGSLLLHDAEEANSGDFPRAFKYSSPELKRMLDRAAEVSAEKVLTSLDVSGLYMTWFSSKDETNIEGRIVRLADFLSAISYLMQEVQAGNRFILEKENLIRPYANLFICNPKYDLFKDLWPGIEEVVTQLDRR